MNKLIQQASNLFKNADFDWCVCGGYALDMFAGKELRPHGDFDMTFFEQDRAKVLQYLMDRNWPIYGRQGGWGVLPIKQFIFYNILDANDPELKNYGFWAVKPDGWMKMNPIPRTNEGTYSYFNNGFNAEEFTFIEVCFDTKEGNDFVLLNSPKITLPMERAILRADSVQYLAPEIILFFKTDEWSATNSYLGPKMVKDFHAILPLLSDQQKYWLLDAIETAHGKQTPWLDEALKGVR